MASSSVLWQEPSLHTTKRTWISSSGPSRTATRRSTATCVMKRCCPLSSHIKPHRMYAESHVVFRWVIWKLRELEIIIAFSNHWFCIHDLLISNLINFPPGNRTVRITEYLLTLICYPPPPSRFCHLYREQSESRSFNLIPHILIFLKLYLLFLFDLSGECCSYWGHYEGVQGTSRAECRWYPALQIKRRCRCSLGDCQQTSELHAGEAILSFD